MFFHGKQLVLLLVLFCLTGLEAQQKDRARPVWERFSYEADLESGKTSGQQLIFGMYSNRAYLEENPHLAEQSMFNREMELVCIPVWPELHTPREMWLYLCRIFPQEPNRPLTQFFNKVSWGEDGRAKLEIYYLQPEAALRLRGAWHGEVPFAGIKPEHLIKDTCQFEAWVDETGQLYSQTKGLCRMPINANFDRYQQKNRLNKKAWFMQVAYYNLDGKLLMEDKEAMRYERLDKKTAKRKVRQYQAMLGEQ